MKQSSLNHQPPSFSPFNHVGNYAGAMARRQDDELATFASSGSETAFAELLSRHRRMVTQIVRRYFQQQHEIEELVQISFIEAWVAISAYRGRGPYSFAAQS